MFGDLLLVCWLVVLWVFAVCFLAVCLMFVSCFLVYCGFLLYFGFVFDVLPVSVWLGSSGFICFWLLCFYSMLALFWVLRFTCCLF